MRLPRPFPRRLVIAVAAAAACTGGALMATRPAAADVANYTTVAANTSAVVAATTAFMSTLTPTQLGTLQSSCTMTNSNGTLSYSYLVGLVECWSNLPGGRNGLRFSALTASQLNAALAVANAALSSRGVGYLSEIRAADDVINAVNANGGWGSGKYSIAIYGVPSTTSSWQLQISGHHLAYNLNFNGTAVRATPLFDGVEPPTWTDSTGLVHAPLESQRLAVNNLAQLVQAEATSKSLARLSGTFTDVTMGISSSGCDSNFPLTYPTGSTGRGMPVSSMSAAQKTLVKNAIQAWTTLVPKVVSNTLAASYTSDTALAETYVGYGIGTSGIADFPANPSGLSTEHSYLRIDGPRVWIEFVVQQGVAYTTQVHYHTLWRDKTADYGGTFTTASAGTTGQCGATTGGGGGPGGPGGPGNPPTPPTMP